MKPMSILKRNNSWYVDFRFGRKRYRKKSPTNTRAGTEMYEASLRQKLARGEPLEEVEEKPKAQIPVLSEFYKTWMTSYSETNNKPSTIISKRSIFEHGLLPYFGNRLLDDIGTKDIEGYKAYKLKEGLKNKTINNHISCLGTCLKIAADWEVINNLPKIKLLKVPPPQTTFLTEDECKALLSTVGDNIYHDMIFTVLRTGLRLGELIALKWSDLDFNNQTMKVQRSITVGIEGSTKSNKVRQIPILDTLINVLLLREKNGEYVFPRDDGSPMSQSQSEKQLKKFFYQAGIKKNISWHGLRHTFASHMANNNVNVQVIKELLGHSDIKTTMRYVHIAQESLVKAIDVLEQNFEFWTLGGHKANSFVPPTETFTLSLLNNKA